ncbi:MAG: TIR domain-containing protein [Candidatus Udaeobacter sp.]
MYSLLVSHEASKKNEGTFTIERGRFLEYTGELISSQLKSLSTEAEESIRSWPCILMEEGRGQELAHLVEIGRLDVTGKDIKATISSLSGTEPILNDALWKLRADLDIGEFEFNRNHWAIKDRDLFATLAAAGHCIDPAITVRFEQRPLPAPSRSDLLLARNAMSEWGHTQIDDFLLEAGVNGLVAGRELGSRRDRANAILQFAFDQPAATTAENSLLSAFLVRQTFGRKDEGATFKEENERETAADSSVVVSPNAESTEERRSPNTVFVVHGQNQTARDSVVSFLETVGLRGVILHEQASMGRHLLTKFIEEAELITFAVVLMTDDDVGALKGAALAPRGRQNVILELGYFLAHLGQRRVCALITPNLETPSDFDGIVYIKMDESGLWKTELRRELRAAGMPLSEARSSARVG